MSFKTKATALAIALGVLPVMAIGGTSLVITQSAINQELKDTDALGQTVKAQQAKALNNQLALILLLGMGVTGALAGFLATLLAEQTTRKLRHATHALEQLSKGEVNTRILVEGSDELAELGSNINGIANFVETIVLEQKANRTKLQNYADTLSASTRGDSQFLFDQ
ncbi:MAG TPA: HAMP domain-containing protein, partial [Vampirovibrionales bacterium]